MMEAIDAVRSANNTGEAILAMLAYNDKLETVRKNHEAISRNDQTCSSDRLPTS